MYRTFSLSLEHLVAIDFVQTVVKRRIQKPRREEDWAACGGDT
jgi:hypothetical protein